MATAEEEAEEELQSQLRAAAIHIRARRTRERTPGARTPNRSTPDRLRTPGAPRTAHPMLSPRSPPVFEEGEAGEGGGASVSKTPREDARLRSD